MTVYELLERRANDRGDQPFLVGEERSLSAAEMLDASNEWSNRFQKAGVQPGDRVLLKLPNSLEFLAVWFGLSREGAVMVPVNPASAPAEVDWFIDHSETRAIVDTEGLRGVFRGSWRPDPPGRYGSGSLHIRVHRQTQGLHAL